MSDSALAHRADLLTLTGLAERDLTAIWDRLDVGDAIAVRDALVELLPDLVSLYGDAAATLAADWYDELRDAARISGRFTAVPAKLPDGSRLEALAGWAVAPLFGAKPTPQTAITLLSGGFQRIIADVDRRTVMESAVADPKAAGWQRVARGGCAFCAMLAGRGVVYTEASADFASHDHCHCVAAPAFDGEPRPVARYTPSTQTSTAASRALAADWIAAHP